MLTVEEGQTILDLMDAAVRSGGLSAASKALPLAIRIRDRASEAQGPMPDVNQSAAQGLGHP